MKKRTTILAATLIIFGGSLAMAQSETNKAAGAEQGGATPNIRQQPSQKNVEGTAPQSSVNAARATPQKSARGKGKIKTAPVRMKHKNTHRAPVPQGPGPANPTGKPQSDSP